MLDSLKYDFDKAVLVDTNGKTLSIDERWELEMSEFELWYAHMIDTMEEVDSVLAYVLTFVEDTPTCFFLDGIELQAMDLTEFEKSQLN